MTVTVDFQNITKAEAEGFEGPQIKPFSIAWIIDGKGGRVSLFLPAGKAQAVADAINAAIAVDAAEPADLAGWQRIGTAPRDGTPFLCVHPPMQPEVAHWEDRLVRLNHDMSVTEISATHWMPLPAPPVSP